ncbi:MAG: biotin--[acetyl-CoA-carboxylase] ligase [Crocinitomicaceae bacterium]|nr:biotin--[acetyl-CoA-carboxylase] ligase [Crocinitomicaceae bacterium]
MSFELSTSQIIWLDAIDSTNNFAANLLKTTKPTNGTVILTKCQEKGRGQRGNVWESESGKNIICSIILYPGIKIKDQFKLTQLFSIAVIKFLEAYGIEGKIKWPNDVYVKDEKIAGILIENSLQGSLIKSSILGIGLNVNQVKFASSVATSMRNVTERKFDLEELINNFLNVSFQEFNRLLMNNDPNLKNTYLENLYGLNQPRKFMDKEGEFEGVIKGVDAFGLLIVEKNGKQVQYDLKEITFVR